MTVTPISRERQLPDGGRLIMRAAPGGRWHVLRTSADGTLLLGATYRDRASAQEAYRAGLESAS